MLFWTFSLALAALIGAVLARAVLKGGAARPEVNADMQVYRDQLAAIDPAAPPALDGYRGTPAWAAWIAGAKALASRSLGPVAPAAAVAAAAADPAAD